jgi:hypothetical protein
MAGLTSKWSRRRGLRIALFLGMAILCPLSLYCFWVLCWPHSVNGAGSAYLTTATLAGRTVLIVDSHPANLLGEVQMITYGYDDRTRTFWIEGRVALFAFPPLWPSRMNFPVAINPRTVAWEELDGRVRVASRSRRGLDTIGYLYFQDGKILRVENLNPVPTEIVM